MACGATRIIPDAKTHPAAAYRSGICAVERIEVLNPT